MSNHYKKLILILIPACAGFCLALALGSTEEPTELTQEEMNRKFFRRALGYLHCEDPNGLYNYWDPNYIHHLPEQLWRFTPLTLDEMISWYQPAFYPPGWPWISVEIIDIITEDDKVVVLFDRFKPCYRGFEDPEFDVLSSEMWILRIADGKIIEGWSVSEPGLATISQEDRNKALVKKAILAYNEDPRDPNLSDFVDPNYVQHGFFPDPFYDIPYLHFGDELAEYPFYEQINWPVEFDFIIAEGDMVSVRILWRFNRFDHWADIYSQFAAFRIANGKIVEGWVTWGDYTQIGP